MWHNYMLTKCQLDNQSKKEKNMRAWRCLKENEPASIYNIPLLNMSSVDYYFVSIFSHHYLLID